MNVFSPPPSLPPRILMPTFLLLLLIELVYAGHWDGHQESPIFICDSILNIYMRSKPHLCIHRKDREQCRAWPSNDRDDEASGRRQAEKTTEI